MVFVFTGGADGVCVCRSWWCLCLQELMVFVSAGADGVCVYRWS